MLIEAVNLHKRFGRFEALNGLSFSVPKGSAYALVGANGAGKSTSIKMMMNMLDASSGDITILGVNSRNLSPAQMVQIGYVSEGQRLASRLTVGEYLSYLRPFYPNWDKDLESQFLDKFNLPIDRKIAQLSHGMKMKLALTSAMAYRPKLLILDEPFTGLDPLVRDELTEGLLQQAGETTILISSHDLGEIEGFITHVGFIEQGKLLFQQSLDELNSRVRAVRVTLKEKVSIPDGIPLAWIDLRAAGSVLTFVDTEYAEQKLRVNVKSLFGEVRDVTAETIDLRSIFTAFARASQDGER